MCSADNTSWPIVEVLCYYDWKDAAGEKGAFNTHQKSATHKRAVEVIFTLPATTGNVVEMLSRAHARERLENREYLLK